MNQKRRFRITLFTLLICMACSKSGGGSGGGGKLIANSPDFGKTEDAYTLQGNTLTIRGVDYTKK